MSSQPSHAQLSQSHFAAALPDAVVERLAPAFVSETYRAGDVIFHEGQRRDRLYVIAQGRVGLEMHIPGSGRRRILSLGPGDLLGWSGLLGEGPMTATATALEDVALLSATAAELLALFEADHEIGYWFMRRLASALAQRLLATRLQLLDLFSDDAPAIADAGGPAA